MLKQIIKKTSMYFIVAIALYLGIGYLFHLLIFPEDKPEVATYFKTGYEFYSATEGFRQKVIKQENGIVYCSLQVDAFAAGPPIHIHSDFDELAEVSNGELSLLINGEVKKLHPGEKILIPKGTPHKPFNETGETIYLKGEAAFPEKFAYNLVQVYGFMDHSPEFRNPGETFLQMIMFSSAGFDSYYGAGAPVIVQRSVGFLLAPLARLLGYKSYYIEYDVFKNQLK